MLLEGVPDDLTHVMITCAAFGTRGWSQWGGPADAEKNLDQASLRGASRTGLFWDCPWITGDHQVWGVCAHACVCPCTHVGVCACVLVCAHVVWCVCLHTCVHCVYACVCSRVCMCTVWLCVHKCMCAYVCSYVYARACVCQRDKRGGRGKFRVHLSRPWVSEHHPSSCCGKGTTGGV